ncbi:MAG: aminoglycoside phosphotransferase [Proteobacteria bacterium]|nr:MAG: aminoglycoside phosphotransferase [Pseudomonadota bacterium]
MSRTQNLDDWLRQRLPGESFELAPASEDASFRRYFRVTTRTGTRILMDAPPEHEDCRPFVKVARLFLDAGVHVPEVLAEDVDNGYLLLSDLGSTTYLQALNPESADELYAAANESLIRIQAVSRPAVLPDYDRALLLRELRLFPDWYVARHLGIALSTAQVQALDSVFESVLANNLAQPRVFVHRDYHSRNLMVSKPCPGILDFQDAVYGPITYDLASLYRDAYIAWEEERIIDWMVRYWEKARKAHLAVASDFGVFYRDFEWMGVQRHIKVLGIFARLFHRDGKDRYLQDIPLVMSYVRNACERYAELTPLLRLLDDLERRAPAVGYSF